MKVYAHEALRIIYVYRQETYSPHFSLQNKKTEK